ncbi:hypothetical protein BHM03_00000026 [Ensete ventricosum]|nr:hypothetical protein BHM03_00000026 [Ensete ventricosum]
MDQVYPDPIPAAVSASPAGHVGKGRGGGGAAQSPAVRHVGAPRSAGPAFLWGPPSGSATRDHVWELRSVPLCPSPLRTLFMSLSPSVRARVSVHVVILEIQLDRREESGAAGAFRARRSGFDVRTGVASAVCVNRLVV